MKVVAIIPTYNEAANVGLLIDRLQDAFAGTGHDLHLLVVDDDSPDGTAAVVRGTMERLANVHLLTGRKRGLGAAYIRGMSHALDALAPDAVMEMDADFSHTPEDAPRLVAALEDGADFVIGSRYVDGGKIPDDWGLHRRMNSRFGNLFARYVAGMRRVRDCTAGFRAIRASLLARLDVPSLDVRGYAFQIALLHRALARSAVVREVPVEFVNRTRGTTKLGLSDMVEFLLSVCRIRYRSARTFLAFCLVGLSGVAVNLGAFTVLYRWGVNRFLASPAAIEISILTNFALNNAVTFNGRNNADPFWKKALKFNLVSLAALVVSYGVFVALSVAFPDAAPQYHQLAGIVPGTAVNYLCNSRWTFRAKAPASANTPSSPAQL